MLLQFRTPYCTNLRQCSKRPKRSGAHDNAQIPNLQFPLPTSAVYNIPAVCCNRHVQENMLISNRFTSIQGKIVSRLSEFRVSLQNFKVSFWHPKKALKNTGLWDWIPSSRSSYSTLGRLSNLGFATSSVPACANSKFQSSGEEH